MTAEQAFFVGLLSVRAQLCPHKIAGSNPAVIAAHDTFIRACTGKEEDERFESQAPMYAEKLILTALSL